MHKIIQNTDNPEIGGKTRNLILLDKENLTPNFLAIDNKIFTETIDTKKSQKEIKTQIKNTNLHPLITKIKEELIQLEITNPIIRSSHLLEDSNKASFAGLFDSHRCNITELEQTIKKVWLSQFNNRASTYMQSKSVDKKIGMGIIIQQYIEGECGGVMLYNKEKEECIIEITTEGPKKIVEGSIKPYKFLLYKGITLSKRKNSFEIFPPTLFENLKKEKRTIDKKLEIGNYDIEFIFKNKKIKILQIRPLIKNVIINDEYSFIEDLSLSPQDEKELMKMFESITKYLNLDIGINQFTTEEERVSIHFNLLKKVIDNLENKMEQNYGEVLKTKCIKLQEALSEKIEKIENQKENLIELKKYLYLITFIDQIVNNSIDILEEKIKTKYDDDEIERNQIFSPDELSLSLANHKTEQGKKPKETSDQLVKNIRKLIWLHDANNFFYEKITKKFHKNLAPLSREDINTITSKSFEDIKKKKLDELLIKKRKTEEPLQKTAYSFPLEGTNINNINFEGTARLIEFKTGQGIKDLKNDEIMVLEETTPFLISEILKCKGIVTEIGGITSHAAIIARELNKPCLIGTEGCLENIKTGNTIKITGNKLYKIK